MGGLPHHSPLSPICLVPVNLSKNCFQRPYGWSLESRGRCEQGKTNMKKSLAMCVSEGTWWEEKNLQCSTGQRNRRVKETKHFHHVNLNSSVSILQQILRYTPLVSL
ncbi:hypothetical protein L208DRAFT_413646 [Tricholoma matsutake]|nr:hypothetical protein L208DRAFT_413646 [Tricholoma matsutake 945]